MSGSMLDRIIELDTAFFKAAKPYGRASNVEWQACMGMGYV